MTTWNVTREDDQPWVIWHGEDLIDTIPSHYDAWEVLDITQRQYICRPVAWTLVPDGFATTLED